MRRGFMLLWVVICVLRAEEPVMNTALQANVFGLAVVKVHLFRGDGTSQEVRMMVDTGSAMTVIDRSLEPGFWSVDQELKGFSVGAMAASGVEVPAEPVLLYQLQFGPLSPRMPKAIRLDLTPLNSAMDVPIAGIIGMNLLRGQCFRMDLRNQVLRWGGRAEGEYLRDLKFKKGEDVPLIKVEVAGHRVEAICDTGMARFLSVAAEDAKAFRTDSDPQGGTVNVDAAGTGIQKNTQTVLGAVSLGSKHWCNPTVEVQESCLLGISAMWPSVWFDFRKNQVGFMVGPSGCLESSPRIKQAIHASWDRSGAHPQLVVLVVKPGSLYEAADIRAGDVMQAFGELKGDSLNLASLRQAVLAQKTRWVVIERKGQTMRIELPEPK
jgi:predicted aspartyl protease